MAFDPKRLRKVFAGGAVFVFIVVLGFYLQGVFKPHEVIPDAPKNIPSGVEKSATGFNLSKSEGGKTLFTIHAASVQQYKEGGKAALHDVSITVFGRNQDRSDQIYGADFAYDPAAKIVTAEGEVRIDLEAVSAAATPAGGPAAETKNLIHVKTSALTFNENTGIAQTKAAIEFRVPEGNGSAVGATYDSHGGVLTLKSAVRVTSTGQRKATITGQSATITRGLCHRFYGEVGTGTVFAAEVSQVNDDLTDNDFLEPLGRFATIEEDEPMLFPLWNELGAVG